MHETHRLSWEGAVDADGHILEPSDSGRPTSNRGTAIKLSGS